MKKLLVCIILGSLLFSCKKNDDAGEGNYPIYISDEFYPVYGALLYPLSSINLVVNTTDTSLNCRSFLGMHHDSLGITTAIIEECVVLNQEAWSLDANKLLSGGLELVTWEEVSASNGNLEILEKYGAISIFRFGHPVFFDNGNAALFELNRFCGPLCGNGALIIARKSNNTWGVSHYLGTWISK